MRPSLSFDRASDHEKDGIEPGFGPPIDLIVIGGNTPDSQRTSGSRGFFTSPSPRRPLVGMTTPPDQEYFGTMSDGPSGTWPPARPQKVPQHRSQISVTGSFKLQPRNPLESARRSSRVSTRGRKRRAHSISVPRPSVPFADEDSGKHSFGSSGGSGHCSQHKNELTLSPLLTMQTLSIQSPTSKQPRGSPLSVPSTGLPCSRPNASSCFSAYAGSPAGSSNPAAFSSSSLASGVSSNKSSPRQIPLTIVSESRSPRKTPQSHRPHFVGHGSTLLYSLDKESPLRHEETRTPRLAPSAPTTAFAWSSAESMNCTKTEAKNMLCGTPPVASPRTPRTPLPRKLNLTPRTPMSGSRNETRKQLPAFPSSTGGDMLDCTFIPNRHTASERMDQEMDKLLMAFSTKAGRDKSDGASKAHDQHIGAEDVVNVSSRRENSLLASSRPSKRTHLLEVDSKNKLSELHPSHSKTPPPAPEGGIKIKSVLTPSKAPGGMLAEMMEAEARAGVLDAETGSLSDSDDEDFILAAPLGLSFNRHQEASSREAATSAEDGPVFVQRARQRRRYGDKQSNELMSNDDFGASRPHSSMTSLAATSTCTSHTSLFGIDIVHEVTSARTTPFSHVSLSKVSTKSVRDNFTHDCGSSSSSHQSRQSIHSLGLCVDETTASAPNKHDDEGSARDLVTPPGLLSAPPTAPPSLPGRLTQGTTTARADRTKLSLAIASMEAERATS
uniref:Uncharacterized protein n=1 Tax=Grammatophora oceanica TaxID=210454 RepID=A0A7S1YJU8_9STRA|mmetsp:Transcript_53418/g.79799  ORF Transcript_53418/g.79799 Transcript_53418/m.79799 type:complete len:725 (+) Transcript_53418:246-2420(+)|eukprot:CAMPEP_0194042728 /NCGR_PEP_ID=MMETSP0009_2-20130614/14476_1 /TAXON_ID=210454 /ORGANISM="Grammatophora oceanica, Strain CCMP 410" /LENGTH=724 /DNA_ID=CAMNT_0038686683 /DNA_START=159 /DNA_END=2333 /DNA_ORIENTATION=+